MSRRRRSRIAIVDQNEQRLGTLSRHRFMFLTTGPGAPFTNALVDAMVALVAPRRYFGVSLGTGTWARPGDPKAEVRLIVMVGK